MQTENSLKTEIVFVFELKKTKFLVRLDDTKRRIILRKGHSCSVAKDLLLFGKQTQIFQGS